MALLCFQLIPRVEWSPKVTLSFTSLFSQPPFWSSLFTSSHWTSLISPSFAFHKVPRPWVFNCLFTPLTGDLITTFQSFTPGAQTLLLTDGPHPCGRRQLWGWSPRLRHVLLLFTCPSALPRACSPAPPHHFFKVSVSSLGWLPRGLLKEAFVMEPCHSRHIWTPFWMRLGFKDRNYDSTLAVSETELWIQLHSINDYRLRREVMGFQHRLGQHTSCCGDKRFSDRAFLITRAQRSLSTQVQSHEEGRKRVAQVCFAYDVPFASATLTF